ncbi:hypothetical protein HOLleu_00070 [Holothuria leucospilota]|uniref:SRCR domain-containing protein n=1 Tax=Holothuria leucospilota TaxID=206669 RepID=A0A9Q1CNK1_HOLLE|nr:hypothetical protein HOLleu_00070 [Holothuria leucospilota]
MDDVQCIGNENFLKECNHSQFGEHDCTHSEDAGVICGVDTDRVIENVRLVDGFSDSSGRTEVLFNGTWGTVCVFEWDLADANVVCRQLGYPSAIVTYSEGIFGSGSGIVWLSNVRCTGNETFLSECKFNADLHQSCITRRRDAGVFCRGKNLAVLYVNWTHSHQVYFFD